MIDATSNEDELWPVGVVEAGVEECVIGTGGAATMLEAGAAVGYWTCGGFICGSASAGGFAGRCGGPSINFHFSTENVASQT